MWWSQDLNQIHWTTEPKLSILPPEARFVAKPQDHTATNHRDQLQRWLSQSQWLLFFRSHPPPTSCFYKKKKKKELKTKKLKLGKKKKPKESKRQLVTISVTADEVTTDTEGKKMKTWKCRLKITWHITEEDDKPESSRKKWASA